jgi:hypothetical protein
MSPVIADKLGTRTTLCQHQEKTMETQCQYILLTLLLTQTNVL